MLWPFDPNVPSGASALLAVLYIYPRAPSGPSHNPPLRTSLAHVEMSPHFAWS